MEKALLCRPGTRRPDLSVTVTLRGTSLVSALNITSPESGVSVLTGGFDACAQIKSGAASSNVPARAVVVFTRISLRRRIVAGSPECMKLRQSPRLIDFNLHLTILAVALRVGRTITEDVLIA